MTSRTDSKRDFDKLFARVKLRHEDFNSERFLPGSSGATRLYNELMANTGIDLRELDR
jgi:hypothetical protein